MVETTQRPQRYFSARLGAYLQQVAEEKRLSVKEVSQRSSKLSEREVTWIFKGNFNRYQLKYILHALLLDLSDISHIVKFKAPKAA